MLPIYNVTNKPTYLLCLDPQHFPLLFTPSLQGLDPVLVLLQIILKTNKQTNKQTGHVTRCGGHVISLTTPMTLPCLKSCLLVRLLPQLASELVLLVAQSLHAGLQLVHPALTLHSVGG